MNRFYIVVFVCAMFVAYVGATEVQASQNPDPYYGPERGAFSLGHKVLPNEFTGSLDYELPLTIPEGRDGFGPKLSLQYSSNNTSNISPFGYGWTISIPYVERMNKKGVNTIYSENYFFSYFDGELKATSTATSTTGYGARTENGSFHEYDFTDEEYWVMTDKLGTTYTFGATTSTQLYNTSTSTQIYRWMLEEIRDKNDNFISYEYYQDSNQVYPSKIKYTGNGVSDGIYEIEFLRESRSDTATSSEAGFEIFSQYRINEIQIKVDGSWVRKYELDYIAGDNGIRSMLDTVTETGRDENLNTLTLPATNFDYTTKEAGWTLDSSWSLPVYFTDSNAYTGQDHTDMGVRFGDIDGDGLIDIVQSRNSDGGNPAKRNIWFNNGDGTWATSSSMTSDFNFVGYRGRDMGTRLIDLNGDGKSDFIRGESESSGFYTKDLDVNTSEGRDFSLSDSSYTIHTPFSHYHGSYISHDAGSRAVDINADGLVDIISNHSSTEQQYDGIFLNDGTSWTASTTHGWYLPDDSTMHFTSNTGCGTGQNGCDGGLRFGDFNGDGLTDIIRGLNSGNQPYMYIYQNNGDGTWQKVAISGGITSQYFTDSQGSLTGKRLADVNGDGLTDYISTASSNSVHLNQGNGTFVATTWPEPPTDFKCEDGVGCTQGTHEMGSRFMDINGDGLVDIVTSRASGTDDNGVYIANGVKADLLKKVTLSTGGEISYSYKGSAQQEDSAAPVSFPTVETITRDDGFGNIGTTTYRYGGASFYHASPHDKRFAGFATSTVTDPVGNVTKTFFHQGNGSQTLIGEYSDGYAKIGKTFRVEEYDDANNLYRKTISKWETTDISNDRDFVKQTREVVFTYDGDTDHVDRAKEWTFDGYGNVLTAVEYGKVTGSDNGTFTDTGSDKRSTTLAYAENDDQHIVGLPKTETVTNNSGAKVAEKKYYYDGLSHGSVTSGDKTKEEHWETGSTYVDWEWTHNGYGLVATETDPRSKTTTFTYDANNLFVATSSNALGQTEEFYRDISSGKVTKYIDQNGNEFETEYDGLDRVITEKQPDIDTPGSLVTRRGLTYLDTVGLRSIAETNYLDTSTSSLKYTYFDGFDRLIQERTEAEDGNYSVRDIVYDANDMVQRESLPYFSSGSNRTLVSANTDLFSFYMYDPMERITELKTVVGSTTKSYDDWVVTVTDTETNQKEYHYDAFERLEKVVEKEGVSAYNTTYEYDAVGNLTKVTDSDSNIRNFTYDGLSQRLTAEDLHAVGDSTFGEWDYTYDDSGNLLTRLDPENQSSGDVVSFTYDDINRVLTEDYVGESGVEIKYSYDSCSNGEGKLCVATSSEGVRKFTYNPLGLLATETLSVDGESYTTSYDYDRQGNQISIIYPDGAETRYAYNSAGLLEEVEHSEGGAFASVLSSIEYAPTGDVTTKTYSNGTETTRTYAADNLYRLSNILTTATSTSSGGSSEGSSNTHSAELTRASDEYFSISDGSQSGLDLTGDMTIEAWIKLASVPGNSEYHTIVSKWEGSDRGYELLYVHNNNTKSFWYRISTQYNKATKFDWDDVDLNADQWYHIAVTFDISADEAELFIDGVSEGTPAWYGNAPGSTLYNSGADFRIGRESGSNTAFGGDIDEVRIWDVARTASEITTNEDTELNGTETNLVGYWKFNNDATDETANGNDLTGNNTPSYTTDVPFGGGVAFMLGVGPFYALAEVLPLAMQEVIDEFEIAKIAEPIDESSELEVMADTENEIEVVEIIESSQESLQEVGIQEEIIENDAEESIEEVPQEIIQETKVEKEEVVEVIEMATSTEVTTEAVVASEETDVTDESVQENFASGQGRAKGFERKKDNVATSSPREKVYKKGERKLAFPVGTPIYKQLVDRSHKQAATLKGRELAKERFDRKVSTSRYQIEILEMEAIEGGVQLYARAWENGQQIGFGVDGTVDIERFQIFNPPVLVDDPKGDILVESLQIVVDSDGNEEEVRATRRLREDPKQALLEALENIIDAKKEKHSSQKIIDGKVGRTTSTFYAAAGDGRLRRLIYSSGGWNTARVASTANQNGGTNSSFGEAVASRGNSGADFVSRVFLPFDTSGLPDSTSITSATLDTYHTGSQDATLYVTESTQASISSLADGDYDNLTLNNPTLLSSAVDTSGFTSDDYNSITLNASGLSVISKTGDTKFVLRTDNDVNDVNTSEVRYGMYFSEEGGTTKDPMLVVEHVTNQAALAPTGLEAEQQTNPTNVSDITPEFSAVFVDDDGGDIAGHYQIQVDEFNTFTAPLWDSTKTSMASTTEGTRSPLVSYGGSSLSVGSTYYWRIRFWDDSDDVGSWSTTTASFSMVGNSGSGIQNIAYLYDSVGNITEIIDSGTEGTGKEVVFGYDDLYRLTSASTTAASSTPFSRIYTYDRLGNITSKTGVGSYLYDGDTGANYANPHAATSIGGTAYTYDKNGNITNDGTWTHTWDYNNRIVGTTNGTTTLSFAYDHEKVRIKKGDGTATTTYANSYFNTNGSTTTKHIFLPDGTLIATIAGSGTATSTQFIHTDHLGGTNLATDEAGDVVEVIDYYPFGAQRLTTGSFESQRKFTGHELDPESDLTYAKARYYDQDVGKFLSQDPASRDRVGALIADPQLMNMYGYARNNPLIYNDPTGEIPVLAIPLAILGGLLLDTGIANAPDTSTSLQGPTDAISYYTGAGPVAQSTIAIGLGLVNKNQSINSGKQILQQFFNKNETARDSLMNSANSPKLKEIINQVYRENKNPIGDGGTADALRYEKQTGKLLSPSGHGQKAGERVNQLNKFLDSSNLNQADKGIATGLRDDLQDALDQ